MGAIERPAVARPKLTIRTPVLEWMAAGLGLILTVAVLGYVLWEGVSEEGGPPRLLVTAERSLRTPGGYVTPFRLRNASNATAAQVEVLGTLEDASGKVIEERRVVLTYVPGGGEARGGLVFEHDPSGLTLRLRPEGYEEP